MNNEINIFAADPAHPYFDDVANDITALLRGGGAKDLADAYDKAVWANPVTRAKEQARRDALTPEEREAEDQRIAEKRAALMRAATAAAGTKMPTTLPPAVAEDDEVPELQGVQP